MMPAESALERRYRRLLAVYPKSWRAQNADALVGTLLDAADAQGRSTVRIGEAASVVGHGIGARLLAMTGNLRAIQRDAVASSAVVLGTVFAVLMLMLGELGPWVRPGSVVWRPTGSGFGEQFVDLGPFTTLHAITYLLWVAAFVAVTLGATALHRFLIKIAVAASIYVPFYSWMADLSAPPLVVSAVLTMTGALALAGRAGRTSTWRLTIGVGTPVVAGLGLAAMVKQLPGQAIFFYNPDTVVALDAHHLSWAFALMLAASAAVIGAHAPRRHWPVLVAVLLVPTVVHLLLPAYFVGPALTAGTVAFLITAPLAALGTRAYYQARFPSVAPAPLTA